MQILDETVKNAVTERLRQLEAHLEGDVAFFYGSIDVSVMRVFRDFVERMAAAKAPERNRLIFFLNTPGGGAEAAEKMVETIRHHYREVFFVVPDCSRPSRIAVVDQPVPSSHSSIAVKLQGRLERA